MIASTQTPAIFTAIEFERNDDVESLITAPLLVHNDDQSSVENELAEKQGNTTTTSKCSFCRVSVIGILVGFIIQVVSLGAYSFMLVQYGGSDETSDVTHSSGASSEGDWFVFSFLSFLTQVDLVIYVLIWIAFTCTMTRNGMAFIRFQYQLPIKRRFVFVLGVYFLVGIVLGAFVAWTLIDLYLGFPIPFGPIATTVLVDLFLCYLMVFCYDLGRDEELLADEDIEGETSCC